jgi:hypothetical protein
MNGINRKPAYTVAELASTRQQKKKKKKKHAKSTTTRV